MRIPKLRLSSLKSYMPALQLRMRIPEAAYADAEVQYADGSTSQQMMRSA
jgi:hypothetical protein